MRMNENTAVTDDELKKAEKCQLVEKTPMEAVTVREGSFLSSHSVNWLMAASRKWPACRLDRNVVKYPNKTSVTLSNTFTV